MSYFILHSFCEKDYLVSAEKFSFNVYNCLFNSLRFAFICMHTYRCRLPGSLFNFLEHQNKFLNKDTDVKLGVLNLDFVSHCIANSNLWLFYCWLCLVCWMKAIYVNTKWCPPFCIYRYFSFLSFLNIMIIMRKLFQP